MLFKEEFDIIKYKEKERWLSLNNGYTVHSHGNEVYLTSPLLDSVGAKHIFATRKGGVSEGVFGGWNFAEGVGKITDSRENVLENYAIAAEIFGLTAGDICRSYQSHTSLCITVDDTHRGVGTTGPKFSFGVDGLVSKTENLLLSVRTADCVPVLLYDPVERVCAAVHAGWRGTVGNITGNAVREMATHGCDPKNLYAAIGPCIGACCYEVGQEVFDAFARLGDFSRCFVPKGDGKHLLDLTLANRILLQEAGLSAHHIDSADLCTKCHGDLFFSHRRMGAERGTMSAFITV